MAVLPPFAFCCSTSIGHSTGMMPSHRPFGPLHHPQGRPAELAALEGGTTLGSGGKPHSSGWYDHLGGGTSPTTLTAIGSRTAKGNNRAAKGGRTAEGDRLGGRTT